MAVKKPKSRNTHGYRQPNYRSAVRVALLLDQLPRHALGKRMQTVLDELGISEQTLHRYLKALNDEFQTDDGEPQLVIENRGEEKWLVRQDRFADRSEAHIYELISMYLSLEIFKTLGSRLTLVDMADQIYDRVERQLSDAHRRKIRDLPRKFFSAPWAPKDYSKLDDTISDVVKAIVFQDVIRIRYKPAREELDWYRVEPLTLLYHKGGLYLIGQSDHHDHPVYFAIERIRELETLKEKFNYPEKYHPEQMLDGAFGIFSGPAREFRLGFPPELGEYICSRRWHKSQKCEVQPDGSVVLTMRVTDSEEVRSWIRGFGQKVKVIAD